MGAEYSYETPVEGADTAIAADDAAATAASTPEADGEAAVRNSFGFVWRNQRRCCLCQ